VNEWPNIPDDPEGPQRFSITHPFHPLCGSSFVALAQRHAWGEQRVFFADPQTQELRSLPLLWTSLAPPDPFLVLAQERTILRFIDLQQLMQLLREVALLHSQEDNNGSSSDR
jgi:hypothetical protein